MKIKAREDSSAVLREYAKTGRSRLSIKILVMVFLFGVFASLITGIYLMPGVLKQDLYKWAVSRGHNALRNGIKKRQVLMQLPARFVQSLKPLEEELLLNIDIKFKHMQQLNKKRNEALSKGILIQSLDDYVPASIRHRDWTIKVKLRLKGDLTDHLKGHKWSFRIHVKGKDHIFGLRRFSLQHPVTRGYQAETLFFETLRHVGVLTPRYFFVRVTINGDDIGLMALEEHFSKELLEASGRQDSVIVRFDESLLWAATDGMQRGGLRGVRGAFDNYKNAPIKAFRSSRIEKSHRLSRHHVIAVGLLRGFVNGTLQPSEVFDAELMGRFLAVAELWGARHSSRWHNQRFSLNPITVKLEPIGFDADLHHPHRYFTQHLIAQDEPLTATMLGDVKIFRAYKEALRQSAEELLNGSLLDLLRTIEQEHLAVLRREFYLLQPFPYDKLKIRAKHLLSLSEQDLKTPSISEEAYPTLIHASLLEDSDGDYVEIANAVPHIVEIRSVRWVPQDDRPGVEFQPLSAVAFPLRLPETPLKSLPRSKRVYYQPLPNPASYSLEIIANIQGQEQHYSTQAQRYYTAMTQHPIPLSTVAEQLSQHPFLTLHREEHTLHVRPGQWQVLESLIIPADSSLTIPAGTTLQFAPREGLIAHGPLHFEGRENARILLQGVPSDNNEGTWQGVVVLNAHSPSHWSHVTVRNTTGIERTSWQLRGGVTFYHSDISMDHCRFQGNRGEDALNIVHAKFQLKDIEIAATASDGFDADFAQGVVERGLFQDIGQASGGDAIDISGSTVTVTDSRFQNISDKALSVGERSKMTASQVIILQSSTGAASKDGSRLDISNSAIKQVQNAGLMAYIKKPEFGPAQIEAHNLELVGPAAHARVQQGSRITIDGRAVASEDVDVDQLYKTIMQPGLR